jgi:hypothetical protein
LADRIIEPEKLKEHAEFIAKHMTQLLGLANEHLPICIGCIQMTSQHHFGEQGPLENVQMQQSFETTLIINKNTKQLLDHMNKSYKQQAKEYSVLFGIFYIIVQFAEVIARVLW